MIYGKDVRSISTLWHTGSQCICLKTWQRSVQGGGGEERRIEICKYTWRRKWHKCHYSPQRERVWGKRGRGEEEKKSYRVGETVVKYNGFVLSRWSKKYWIFWSRNGSQSFPPTLCVCIFVSANWFSLFFLFFSSALNIVKCTCHCLSITTYWNIMRLESLPLHRSKWVCF